MKFTFYRDYTKEKREIECTNLTTYTMKIV